MRAELRRVLLSTAVALPLLAAPLTAQSRAVPPRATRDSLATVFAFSAILHEVTGFLSARAFDTTATAWRFAFPSDSSGIRWSAVQHELNRLLHARPEHADDRRRAQLRVMLLRHDSDSLVVEFEVGAYWRCGDGNRWQGSHTRYRLAAAWSPLLRPERAQRIESGDLAPCRR